MAYEMKTFKEGDVIMAADLNSLQKAILDTTNAVNSFPDKAYEIISKKMDFDDLTDSLNQTKSAIESQIYDICVPFEAKGEMVQSYPIKDFPLEVISYINLEPSNLNVNPSQTNPIDIKAWKIIYMKTTGSNLVSYGTIEFDEVKEYSLQPPLPPGTYTITATITSTDTDRAYSSIFFNEGAKAYSLDFERNKRSSRDITISEPITKILFCASGNRSTSENDKAKYENIQIEYSSSPSENFIPYEEGSLYTADLSGLSFYGGEYNWKTGVLKNQWKYIEFDGSDDEVWNKNAFNGNGEDYYYIWLKENIGGIVESAIVCSHLPQAIIKQNVPGVGINVTNELQGEKARIVVRPILENGEEWVDYLKRKPIRVIYKTVAPFEERQLIPQQILSRQGANYSWSNCGNTCVKGPSDTYHILAEYEARIVALENKNL